MRSVPSVDVAGLRAGEREDMLDVALHGFHAARARYEAHQRDDEPADVIVPLAEALWWAMSLDEALDARMPSYAARRDGDYRGEHVRGARFVRNRINHQLALAVERIEGRRYPRSYPLRHFEFLWLPVDRLPAPTQADLRGGEMYGRHLAGNPVRLTLDAAASWFAREQNEPGSVLSADKKSPGL